MERVATKREVLRCVMSLFDPLGLLASFVIHGKMLNQDLWRSGIQWDEEISDMQHRDWRRWVDVLHTIDNIRVPRCYFVDATESMYNNAEWHLFVHASQNAYSCVLYLRTIDSSGEAQCSLVSAKAKVAPLKQLSIPKLELQACLLGSRFLKYTQQHHPLDTWPVRSIVKHSPLEEMCRLNVHVEEPVKEMFPILIERLSRLERLYRAVAWINRYIGNLRRKGVQAEFYLSSRKDGSNSRWHTVAKRSPAYQLLPFIDEEGVLRMESRLAMAAEVPYPVKYPVILPQGSRLTELLVESYHRTYRHANKETVVNELRQQFHIPKISTYRHANKETVVNELRQQFHIPKIRAVLAKVVKSCVYCKIRQSLPHIPPMAPLPKERSAQFTVHLLDYFGPILVKRGRTNEKRWVALFTCLTISAIHLEVVHNLSTESCVMTVRRIVARRGAPAEFFNDNGTHLVGASNQLRKEIEARNETLATTFTNASTRWNFNPPGAPHMGGVRKRMVRSVKAAISTIMEVQCTIDDEAFVTVIQEAETMVNSHPLTYIPVDPENQEALTPYHFLLGSSSGVKEWSRTTGVGAFWFGNC
uniref:Uncharacterized protein n=1 Tax=Anopheles stephensi TaxID=30069 RepID=A0A182YPS0_ANOST